MKPLLRALIIEDSADDTELLVIELKRTYDLTFQRVETPADLVSALARSAWDVILADYSVPGIDAPAALKLMEEQELDIPLIIVSGTIGEEAAVHAMRSGATDYVPKTKLMRLPPVIDREIRDAEARRKRNWAEEQLRRSEERFAKIFHTSPVGIAITRASDSMVIDCNPKFLDMLEYERDDVIGRTVFELHIWVDLEDRARMTQYLIDQGAVYNLETRFRTKSGGVRHMLSAFEFLDLSGQMCVLMMAHDITERKQAGAELTALYNATSYLFKADNLLELGRQIVQAVVAEFGKIDCGLLLVDRKQSKLLRLARSGEFDLNLDTPLYLDGPGLVVEAVRTGQMVYAPEASAHPLYVAGDPRTRSELVVPLPTAKGVLGALDLQSSEPEAFSESDQRVLSAFAERAAAAIEIVGLYEEINQRAAELEWRVAQRTAELQRAKERVEAILDNTGDAIVLARAEGGIEQINPAFQSLFGYVPAEVLGHPLTSVIENEQVGGFSTALGDVLKNNLPLRIEVRCVRKDGTVFEGDIALAPVTGYEEKTPGVICSIRDITDRKRAEDVLRESEARFRGFFEQPLVGMALMSIEKNVMIANDKLCAMLGYELDELLRCSWSDITHPDDLALDVGQFNRVVAGDIDGYSIDKRLSRKDGNAISVIMSCRCVRDGQGKATHFVVLVQDITERKRAEEELHRAFAKQKELNDLKSRFTSMVSHEFRTPLAVMQSSLELVKNYADRLTEDKKRMHLENAHAQVKRLTDLLNDILALSRAEAVDLEYQPSLLDLDALSHQIVEEMHRVFATHQIRISANQECRSVYADEELLRQALSNLLTNAAKYSPAGSTIHLDLACEDNHTVIQVRDEGIGIPIEDQARLFEPFHRAKNVGKIQGTGLGLAIVKRSVEAHGGTISVTSQTGIGTTFTMNIPTHLTESH
jgi:PAS domain S-box-containing protein